MKVLIRFSGDNDFTQVIMAFAKIIAPTTQQLAYPAPNDNWHQDRLTKQNIIKWFNTMAPALYEMVQARSRDPKTDQINIAGYLKINEDDVFLEIKKLLPKWKRIKVGVMVTAYLLILGQKIRGLLVFQ